MAEYVEREQIKKAIHCSGDDLLFMGGKTYIDFEIVKKLLLIHLPPMLRRKEKG